MTIPSAALTHTWPSARRAPTAPCSRLRRVRSAPLSDLWGHPGLRRLVLLLLAPQLQNPKLDREGKTVPLEGAGERVEPLARALGRVIAIHGAETLEGRPAFP